MNAIKIIIESNMPFHHLHISLASIEKATVGKIKKYICWHHQQNGWLMTVIDNYY